MRHPNNCPCCRAKFVPELWNKDYFQFTSHGPWAEKLSNSSITCHQCRANVFALSRAHDPDNAVVWAKHKQKLEEGFGYSVLRRRHHAGRLNGRKPTIVCWAYMPLATEAYLSLMHRTIESQPKFLARDDHSILVYPHGADTTWAMDNTRHFDEVWVLDADVTQGAEGPYPSVRAEWSLLQTVSGFKPKAVYHYWPSATLIDEQCAYLGSEDELKKDWALYSRTSLPIKVGT